MLRVEGLSKNINGKSILENINLSITHNVLMSGESGSGKSTLAQIIAGLDSDYQGNISLNAHAKSEYTTKEWMKRVQYIPQYQRETLNEFKTVEYILKEPLKNYHFPKKDNIKRIQAVLKSCVLPPSILKQRIGTLSGGQFQRVWIAKALIIEPEMIILDEATTNLDVISEDLIIQMLKSLNDVKLMIISHDPYVLQAFQGRQLHLKHGRIND